MERQLEFCGWVVCTSGWCLWLSCSLLEAWSQGQWFLDWDSPWRLKSHVGGSSSWQLDWKGCLGNCMLYVLPTTKPMETQLKQSSPHNQNLPSAMVVVLMSLSQNHTRGSSLKTRHGTYLQNKEERSCPLETSVSKSPRQRRMYELKPTKLKLQ